MIYFLTIFAIGITETLPDFTEDYRMQYEKSRDFRLYSSLSFHWPSKASLFLP